jgi:hypothetical protein
MRASRWSAVVFVASAPLFLLLRSRDFFTADGSLRGLAVYRDPEIFFHPNNHLLFPVNVLVWSKLMAFIGFRAVDPTAFLVSTAAMNCLAAAAILAIVSWVIAQITGSANLGVLIPLGLALTNAFMAQATNANEPMVGVLWSMVGVALAIAAIRGGIWAVVLSGLCFSLAMACYRSTVLMWPAAAMVLAAGAVNEDVDKRRLPIWKQTWIQLAVFALATAAGCAAIFGWAYARQHVSASQMALRFLQQEDSRVYMNFSLLNGVHAVLGLVRNCFPLLSDFVGFRAFLAGPKWRVVAVSLLVLAVTLALAACTYELAKRRNQLSHFERIGAVAAATALSFTLIPVLIWSPHYGKLWIQPLICLSVLVAIALNRLFRRGGWISHLAALAGVAFLVGAAFNLRGAVYERNYKPSEFDHAEQLAKLVGEHDLIVGDWSSMAVVYGSLRGTSDNSLFFIDEAVVHGSNAVQELADATDKTRARGGTLYFVSLLDIPEAEWNSFLGSRCGVPYRALAPYRAAAIPKATLHERRGAITVWQVDPARIVARSAE